MNDRGTSDVCPGSALAARPQLAQREQSIIIIIVRLTLLRSLKALTIDDHRRLAVCTRVVYEVKSKWLGVCSVVLSPSGLLWRRSSEIDRIDSMWTCMQAGKAAENRRRGVTQNRKEGRGIGGRGKRAKEQVVRLATRNFVRLFLVLLQCCCRFYYTTLLETTGQTKQHFFPPSQPTSHESSS